MEHLKKFHCNRCGRFFDISLKPTKTGKLCKECLHLSKLKVGYAEHRNEELRIEKIKDTWNKKIGNVIIQPEEPFLSPKCSRCEKNPATKEHTCPFAEDINGDSETLCDCCDDCCQQCADDI